MTDSERKMWTAVREADEKFGVDGAGGTKTWIRDYLAPAMEKYGVRFTDEPRPSCAALSLAEKVVEAAKLAAKQRQCTYGDEKVKDCGCSICYLRVALRAYDTATGREEG